MSPIVQNSTVGTPQCSNSSSINTTNPFVSEEKFTYHHRRKRHRKHPRKKNHHHRHHRWNVVNQLLSDIDKYRNHLHKRSHSPYSPSTSYSSYYSSEITSSNNLQSTSASSSSTNSSSQPVPLKEMEDNSSTSNNENNNNNSNEQETKLPPETIDEHIQDCLAASKQFTAMCHLKTNTRMDAALADITDEELEEFVRDKPKRAESMKRKDEWVMTLYLPWCFRTKKDPPFPLEPVNICAFIRFMAIKCGYTLKGLELIVVPCLKRLNFDATRSTDPRVFQLLKEEIRTLRHNPDVIKEGEGKPPLCYFDVAELIRRLPDNLSFKDCEASLFLFALHTGSRALTCEGVRYRDIIFAERDDAGPVMRVIINQQITKGNPNWNHPVCIEGFPEKENPLDVVFYLNRHCVRSVGKTIEEIVNRTETPHPFDDEFVWPFKRDAMRERLKIRLIQTGFPEGRWSFHSLRSGHICSCLLIAGADSARKGAVLETSAITAGWKMYGTSQRRYIKKVAERTIVSSRLIGAGVGLYEDNDHNVSLSTTGNHEENPTAPPETPLLSSTSAQEQSKFVMNLRSTVASQGFVHAPHTTEAFHMVQLKTPTFPPSLFVRDLRQLFDLPFMSAIGEKDDKKAYCQNSFNRLMVRWGSEGIVDKDNKITWATRRKLGHDRLVKLLTEDRRNTWELAAEMLDELKTLGVDPSCVPKKKYREKRTALHIPTIRQTVTGRTNRTSRKRKRWTAEEDAILIEAKRNHIQFVNIVNKLPDREILDLYPRWKKLVKKNPELADIQ